MRRRLLLAASCLPALGCSPRNAPPQVSAFGSGEPVSTALNLAQRTFVARSLTYGRPADAARAAAAMEYVVNAIPTDPQLFSLPADTKQGLIQGRAEVRAAIGISADAPSSLVIDRLLAAAAALERGDQEAAARELAPLVSSGTGEQMVTRLADLPYMQAANAWTSAAADQLAAAPSNELNATDVIVP